jgi:ABC-type multidrug transport system fused ATPase/permease subunit
MLRKSRLLMLDEATASIDPETDAFIQTAIRHQFQAATVLTVAHRLNTIMDSDRVLVMEDGVVVGENGTPEVLLCNCQVSADRGTSKYSGFILKDSTLQASYLRTVPCRIHT